MELWSMTSTKDLAPPVGRTTLQPVKYGGLERGDRLFAALMILPTVIVVLAITAFPFFYSAWLSVNELNQFTKRWIFVGLDNYALTWQSGDLRDAFGRTLIFCVITVIGGTLLGLFIAIVLNERFRGRGVMRSLVLLPWSMSGVVVGYLWGWIFSGEYGTLNAVLNQVGLLHTYVPWLSLPNSALEIVAIVYIWQQAPLAALLFLAALQAIPQNLYNAAKVDGAGAIRRFWHITLPWLRPMGLLVIILATINAVLAFDLFFLLTGGGPGSSTTVLSWLGYAYAFHFFKFGQGAATLYVLSIVCLILAYVYMRLLQGDPTGGREAPALAVPGLASESAARDMHRAPIRRQRPVVRSRRELLSPRMAASLRRYGLYLAVIWIALWVVMPFYILVTASFSNTVDLLGRPPNYVPSPPTLQNYCNIFLGEIACNSGLGFGGQASSQLVPAGLRNSFIVATVVTVVNIVIGGLAGYAYARYQRFSFMRTTLWILMMTRMIPGLAIAIPFFILFQSLGLIDTTVALIIAYTTFILPLTVWIMKGYFETLPPSLERAALVDGCSRLGAFLRIIVPIARPGLVAAAIFTFIVAWNEFLFALILTGTANSQTIPVIIAGFTQQVRSSQYGSIFASGVVAILPPVLVALIFQRHLVQGMTSGSTKE
jgi:multiple sugar transport system permease protein